MTFVREDVTFHSADAWCAAWLYRPQAAAPRPLVVMAHGFSATREMRLDAYAERFASAGLGVLLFDYRHFGASGGEPRQLLDIARQHADYRAAIEHARSLDWVDWSRIALFGSSFSGGHVLVVAASDQRIAAVVSQCPFTDGLATLRVLGVSDATRLTVHGLRDQAAALRGGPPHYIPAAGEPGTLAVMTTPDALPGMRAITPAQSRWENRVAARIALRVAFYRPGLAASRIAAPVLFCVCDHDRLCPPERTVQLARKNPRAEVRRYPIGHFDIYVGEYFERAVSDQVDFLVRQLSP
jgi:cephalosporin-C deacetylase-like acetyl esterase